MKTSTLYYLVAIALLLSTTACKKFVDIPPPKNQLVTSKVFADSVDANSAVVGIYIDMYQSFGFSFASGGLTAYPGLSSDELSLSSNDPEMSQFFDNRIDVRNNINNTLWSAAYKYIYDVNACIEGINGSKISPTAKSKLLAEARQIRAFIYFNLVNLYGPVPLVKTTDYHINQSLPRASLDSVYALVIKDLTFARSNLPKDIAAERANFYSSSALLAKVQLYRKNYPAVETLASDIISSGNYKLEPNLNDVFLAGSAEAIWKIIPVFQGFETWEGYNFVPSDPSAVPSYVLTNSLFNSFETGDLRKTTWINDNVVGGTAYPYPYKYKAATTGGQPSENYVLIRLGELYLIRAEARAQLNDLSGALDDLNLVRKRAGLKDITAVDKATALLAIEKERRSELFCEWGNRWFDLQRTNRADDVLGSGKANWKHFSLLYPIPDIQIKSNIALTQNEGY